MAWSVLQSAKTAATAQASTQTATFTTANASSGTKLIACMGWNDVAGQTVTIGSVQDVALNSMTQIGFLNNTTNQVGVAVYAMDTPAGDVGIKPAIKVTFSAGTPECSMVVLEVSGLATGNTLAAMIDGGALAVSSSGSAPPLSSGAYSSTASNEFLIGVFGDNGGPELIAKPSAWSTLDANSVNNNSLADCCAAYTNSSNAAEGGTSAQWTRTSGTGTGCASLLTAFKLAAGGPATGPAFFPKNQAVRARYPQPQAYRAGLVYGSLTRTGDTSFGSGRIAWSAGAPVNNPAPGPVFRQAAQPARARIPQRASGGGTFGGYGPAGGDTSYGSGRAMWSAGAPVNNPVQGPKFTQKPAPVRFMLPPWQPRAGRIGSSFGAVVQNPSHGPPVYAPLGPVRPRIPRLQPRAGRVASSPGAPVRNPVSGPVFTQKPYPVRARFPLPERGRTYSNPGGPVQNPAPSGIGPAFRPAASPARIRPALPPRGRSASNAGAPVRNPSSGPVFRQAAQPARSRVPQTSPRGRVSGTPGGVPLPPVHAGPPVYPLQSPVRARLPLMQPPAGRISAVAGPPAQNPAPGPVFRQASSPARIRPALPPRGRTASGRGAPVQNPAPSATGPVFVQRTFARAQLPLPHRGTCRAIRFGPLPANPSQGPPVYPLQGEVRAPIPQTAPRGRVSSNPGGPVQNPAAGTGPVFFPFRFAVRIRPSLPRKGRVAFNAGVPVRNPVTGPVFRQAAQPVRARIVLPPRGRIAFNKGAPVSNPAVTTGPVFYPRNTARAQLPLPRRGACRAIRFYPAVSNPQQGVAFPAWGGPVQARVPQRPRGGRISFTPLTAQVPVPNVVAVTGAIPAAVRAALPVHLRGTVTANPGTPVSSSAPSPGPVFRQATQPARIRPSLPPRGRVTSNPGVSSPAAAPGVSSGQPAGIRVVYLYAGRTRSTASHAAPRNPSPGPVFRQAVRPAQARFPLPPRGRVASNPGGPVQNPAPVTTGPAFRQATAPARIRPTLPPRGRTASSPGAPVRNPHQGAVFPAWHGPVQARIPQVFSKGRANSNPGGPFVPGQGPVFRPAVRPVAARLPVPFLKGRAAGNPGGPVRNPVAPVYPLHGPVRAASPLPPRGRTAGNPGIPVPPPLRPAPVYPLHGPVQARRPLPPHGRCITGNPGGPVRNPHQGAVFHSLPWPARTRVPQNAPRGRTNSNPGGPVENIPFATLRFRTGTPFFQWPSGVPGYQWAAGTPGFQQATGVPEAG